MVLASTIVTLLLLSVNLVCAMCWLVVTTVVLRMAGIKHKLGLHEEAISDYTTLLDADRDYVPALKGNVYSPILFFVSLIISSSHSGRGESLLSLAKLALDSNFDGKAVDLISVALSDFTKYTLRNMSFSSPVLSPLALELLCSDHLMSVTGS